MLFFLEKGKIAVSVLKYNVEGVRDMHQAIVNIMLDRIQDQFVSEKIFCDHFLTLSMEEWEDWKTGKVSLSSEKMQKLKSLFSDYEWMLIQKIARQTNLFPEKRNYVVSEYKRLKSIIAKEWINTGMAKVELISEQRFSDENVTAYPKKHIVNLRIFMSYGEWGYDDILEFCMPGVIQQQIQDSQVDLLEWVDENLIETYT